MRRKAGPVVVVVVALLSFAVAPAAGMPSGLTATRQWEAGVVQEPSVWFDGHHWRMIYMGGWAHSALGLATADAPSGPWRKYPRNPVLGDGASGVRHPVAHANVYIEGATAYLYYPSSLDNGDLMVATAPIDRPQQWTTRRVVLRRTRTALGIVNTSLTRGPRGYVLMFESRTDTPAYWETGDATAPTPLGPFTIRHFPVAGLSHGGMFGGPDLHRTPNGWQLYYQASTSGVLPTDIYRAWSSDAVHWRSSTLVIRHAAGEDQAADMEARGRWAYWSVTNNEVPSGSIETRRLG